MVVEPVTERAEVVAPTALRLVKLPSVAKRFVEVALVVVPLTAKRFDIRELVAKKLVLVALVEVLLLKSALTKCEVDDAWSPCTNQMGVEVEFASAP